MTDAERIADLERQLAEARETNRRFHRRMQAIEGFARRQGDRAFAELRWYREWIFHGWREEKCIPLEDAYTEGKVAGLQEASDIVASAEWGRCSRPMDVAGRIRRMAHSVKHPPRKVVPRRIATD